MEFGPGVGLTAAELLAARPAFYVGIEPNTEGRAKLDAVLAGRPARVVTAEASATGLDAGSADLVVGEAMLTMSSPQQRRAIVAEAARVLAAGGRYAIHELALADAAPDPDRRTGRGEVSREISRTIKVGGHAGEVGRLAGTAHRRRLRRGLAGHRPDAPAGTEPPDRRRGADRLRPVCHEHDPTPRGAPARAGHAQQLPGTQGRPERGRHGGGEEANPALSPMADHGILGRSRCVHTSARWLAGAGCPAEVTLCRT